MQATNLRIYKSNTQTLFYVTSVAIYSLSSHLTYKTQQNFDVQ